MSHATGPGDDDARLDATGPWRDEFQRREDEAASEAAATLEAHARGEHLLGDTYCPACRDETT